MGDAAIEWARRTTGPPTAVHAFDTSGGPIFANGSLCGLASRNEVRWVWSRVTKPSNCCELCDRKLRKKQAACEHNWHKDFPTCVKCGSEDWEILE